MSSSPSALNPTDLSTTSTHRELLSFYDDATGEHTALSAAQLGRWVAMASAMLRDGCGLGPGHRAVMQLSPHWHSAIVLLGAWAAGLSVSDRPWATAGLSGHDQTARPDVLFVSLTRLTSWLEQVPDAEHRFVLGLGAAGQIPDGYRDAMAEISRYPDVAPDLAGVPADAEAVPGPMSFAEFGDAAKAIAVDLGFGPTDRIMVDVAGHEQALTWLLGPLSVGASVVVCANMDPAKRQARMAAEGITRLL